MNKFAYVINGWVLIHGEYQCNELSMTRFTESTIKVKNS